MVAPGFPLKLGATQVGDPTPAPLVGSDNAAIWGGLLGLDVARLKESGAI